MKRHKSSAIAGCILAFSLVGCGAMPEEAGEQPEVAAHTAAQVVSCPSPKSCAGWSSWYNLGASYCQSAVAGCEIEICRACHCTQDGCDECCTTRAGQGTLQKQESFRNCTLQNNQPCREYRERVLTAACGC